MPQRFLKPGITRSRRWNRVSWAAQSLFTRLVTVVDDYGRYNAHPLEVACVCFPYGDPLGRRVKPEQAEVWLSDLEAADLLVRYQVNGEPYLALKRWTERVRSGSKYPAPPVTCQQVVSDAARCCQMPANAASPPSPSPSPSPSPKEEEGAGRIKTTPEARFAALRETAAELRRIYEAEEDPEKKRVKRREWASAQTSLTEFQLLQAKGRI